MRDMNIQLDIAGFVYRLTVDSPLWFSYIKRSYVPFMTKSRPNYFIQMRARPGLSERYAVGHIAPTRFMLDVPRATSSYRQFNFFLKTIVATTLLSKGGLILHASAIQHKQAAVLFAGREGRGKSTIVQLIPEYEVLNDDFAILRCTASGYDVYSSPFYETNEFPKQKKRVTLSRLFFLRHASEAAVMPMSRTEAMMQIALLTLNPLSFMSKSWKGFSSWYQKDIGTSVLTAAKQLSLRIPCNLLQFRKDRSFLPLIQ